MAIWPLLYIKEEWCESKVGGQVWHFFKLQKIRPLSKLIFYTILMNINKIGFLYFCRFHVYRQNIPLESNYCAKEKRTLSRALAELSRRLHSWWCPSASSFKINLYVYCKGSEEKKSLSRCYLRQYGIEQPSHPPSQNKF